jgi:hypothetical protein
VKSLGKNLVQLGMIKYIKFYICSLNNATKTKNYYVHNVLQYITQTQQRKNDMIAYNWISISASIDYCIDCSIAKNHHIVSVYSKQLPFPIGPIKLSDGDDDDVTSIKYFMKILVVWMILENNSEWNWLE